MLTKFPLPDVRVKETYIVQWALPQPNSQGNMVSRGLTKTFEHYSDALNLVDDLKINPEVSKIRLIVHSEELVEFWVNKEIYDIE